MKRLMSSSQGRDHVDLKLLGECARFTHEANVTASENRLRKTELKRKRKASKVIKKKNNNKEGDKCGTQF